MATSADWSCPICREASTNIAYVGNCLHQFCHSCIVRWARKHPSCPLCRQTVHTIIYPAERNQSLAERAVPQPSEPQSAGPRDEPSAAEPQPQGRVGGFPPETWALCFRTHAEVLRPVELWLAHVLCGACWWDVAFARGRIVASLCRYGLHEESLTQALEPVLREQTVTFVRRLIEVASAHCTELARRCVRTAPSQAEAEAEPQPQAGSAALPGTSRAPEPSREGSEQHQEGAEPAGASVAAQSGRSGPEAAGQSRRRRGGSRDGGAAHKKRWRRQR